MERYTNSKDCVTGTHKTTIYIAGPMRGCHNYNFPAFDEAAARFREAGYEVVSPADLDRIVDGFDPIIGRKPHPDFEPCFETCMARDLAAVVKCDVIALLPGWETSEGAKIELSVGIAMGKIIIDSRQSATAALVPISPSAKLPTDLNPKDKIGRSKPPIELIPPSFLIHTAMAFRDGGVVKQYGPFNWRKTKVNGMLYLGAALRHIAALIDGEDYAQDSGIHHAAHAAAGLGIFLDAQECGTLEDDRPPKGNSPDIIARFIKQVKEGK